MSAPDIAMLEGQLRERFGARLERDRRLAELTSFQIGGPAEMFLMVEDIAELAAAKEVASRHSFPCFCLGSGTNLLVSDRGIRGLVLKLGDGFKRIELNGFEVHVGAAAHFSELAERTVERGLAGLEFGEGIPGTVGGGLVMNAGAFGGEIARVVTAVRGVSAAGAALTLNGEEVGFAYRRTSLPAHYVIAAVDFRLAAGDPERLRARVSEIHAKRTQRQPRNVPNAGSIFKNPPGGFAGRLLEAAGLKGERMGGAAFSDQHANFIVNLGGARAGEVLALIELARERVKASAGVTLEPEVRLVGEW
jgi:UDP-N-acetylmuramate dehydrogenase